MVRVMVGRCIVFLLYRDENARNVYSYLFCSFRFQGDKKAGHTYSPMGFVFITSSRRMG